MRIILREVRIDPSLLLMSDHLFEPPTAKRLLHQSISQDEVILAVDRKIHTIFDLDATKVRLDGEHVVHIEKNIACYDALGTGMFLCGSAIFEALESLDHRELLAFGRYT